MNSPAETGIPGCVGTRNLKDNLSDLKAQVAANQKGILLVRMLPIVDALPTRSRVCVCISPQMTALIQEYGLEVVTAYMGHIMFAAEQAVRDMLVKFSLRKGMGEIGQVHAEDQMDDGTPICLTLSIDRTTRTAEFDFTGTGPEASRVLLACHLTAVPPSDTLPCAGLQVLGNCNAPPAVTYSAVIYCLRCLVGSDIPLNQVCCSVNCAAIVDFMLMIGCPTRVSRAVFPPFASLSLKAPSSDRLPPQLWLVATS